MKAAVPSYALNLVIMALEETFYLTGDQIKGRRRTREVAFARQLGMVALVEHFNFSLSEASSAFGRICHGTALHALRSVAAQIETCHYRRAKVREFSRTLAAYRAINTRKTAAR